MPLDSPAARGCPTLTAPAVPTFKLRAIDVTAPTWARRTVVRMLAGIVPTGHLDEVELCVSELVTNALRAAQAFAAARGFSWTYQDTPIHLSIESAARWTRLDVRDPDPTLPTPQQRDLMDESGKGLVIVNALAVCRWWEPGPDHKTVHAVIPMPQVELTAAELEAAKR